jgi:hypothetical protein
MASSSLQRRKFPAIGVSKGVVGDIIVLTEPDGLHPIVVAEVVIESVASVARCHSPAGGANAIHDGPSMLNVVRVGAAVVLEELRREQHLALALVADDMHGPDRMPDVVDRECRFEIVGYAARRAELLVPLTADIIADPDRHDDAE